MLWVLDGNLLAQGKVLLGAEQPNQYLPLVIDKRVGLVANAASVVSGVHVVELLHAQGVRIKTIFSPEHGFRMSAAAGESVGNSVDSITGVPIISLYGKKKKPDSSDMKDLDVVIFDLQDVGVRFYTYISTMTFMMEACRDAGIPMILFDRPNPNAFYIDGPVLEKEFVSFVGLHPVPVVYGMTIGEYALMVNGEGWLKGKGPCMLHVISMKNFDHRMICAPEVRPSPNLRTLNSMLLYPSLCFFEGTDISVGRGTYFPFEVYGHPDLINMPFTYTPKPIAGIISDPLQSGKECRGEDLRDYFTKEPRSKGKITLKWLIRAYQNPGRPTKFFTSYFNLLAGNATLQQQIASGLSEKKIRVSWKPGLSEFLKIRKKYLLYTDFLPG
jgi:uncharacterized protein YbbC (DUF1343 family)